MSKLSSGMLLCIAESRVQIVRTMGKSNTGSCFYVELGRII